MDKAAHRQMIARVTETIERSRRLVAQSKATIRRSEEAVAAGRWLIGERVSFRAPLGAPEDGEIFAGPLNLNIDRDQHSERKLPLQRGQAPDRVAEAAGPVARGGGGGPTSPAGAARTPFTG